MGQASLLETGALLVQCSLALALGATAVVVSGGSASPFANCVGQSASEPSPAVSQTSPPVRLPEPSRETAMATPVERVSQPPWGRLPLFFGSIVLNELRCCLHRCAFTSHRRIDPGSTLAASPEETPDQGHGLFHRARYHLVVSILIDLLRVHERRSGSGVCHGMSCTGTGSMPVPVP